MRRAKGRGEVQIFLDGEVLIERVVLRNVSDVFAQGVAIGVKRAAVEEDVSLGGLKLPGQSAHERALAASARAHHANHFAALHGKRDAVDRNLLVAEPANEIVHLERANNVALLFEKALGKIAAQDLPRVDADGVAVGKRREVSNWHTAHQNRAISLEHLDAAFLAIVITVDLQQHITPASGRKQDVVLFEKAGIIGNEIFTLGGLELKTPAELPRAAAQIAEVQLAVVVENDVVLERGFDGRTFAEPNPLEHGIDILQSRYPNP